MAAAVAVGSCFSAAITPCIQSKHAPPDAAVWIVGLRPLRMPNVAYYSSAAEHLSVGGGVPQKWRLPRISAAVAQEEAAAAATVEAEVDEEVKGEGEGEVQGEGEGGVEGEGEGGVVAQATVVSTKLYFGNLPYNCDSSQLAGIIQEYASPEMVEVLYDRDTGRSRGFAFVTMSSIEDCEAVIQNLDGCLYGGRTLRVNLSDKPKAKEPLYPESEHKLFVGNLSWSVTSESLTQVFQEYGNVVGARVLYDGDTGRSRGYGFVCYSTKTEMETALQSLDGVELEGRAMRVSLALGKSS